MFTFSFRTKSIRRISYFVHMSITKNNNVYVQARNIKQGYVFETLYRCPNMIEAWNVLSWAKRESRLDHIYLDDRFEHCISDKKIIIIFYAFDNRCVNLEIPLLCHEQCV